MSSTRVETLPMIPLREAVVFPHTMVPFVVGRAASIASLSLARDGVERRVFFACQRSAEVERPSADQIHAIGTVATVVQSLRIADGNLRILVEGQSRGTALEVIHREDGGLSAKVELLREPSAGAEQLKTLASRANALFEAYVTHHPILSSDALLTTIKADRPGRLADTIAAHLSVEAKLKQELLEQLPVRDRLQRLIQLIEQEVDKLRVDRRVNERVREQLERSQREYYLSEKIRAIREELGRGGREQDIEGLRQRIEAAGLPAEALEKARSELRRLEAMPPVSAEATVSSSYLDWLASVPWKRRSPERRDLARARRILEADHHGLEPVKERILEHLAVRRMAPKKRRGTILCFVGPPGVGKTSLARSIARATGRKFIRLSLGGVRDEAEIRGHRRTYVGALPGRLLQLMRKAGTTNPVFLLDELDKMSTDFRGDPSAALLEVLDPEQNHSFVDHYLDTEFDLSQVFFVATANVEHAIPAPLMDRLETIRLAGYTLAEKLEISNRYLLPKQLSAHGLVHKKVTFDHEALVTIVERYTREAGVRELERNIAKACRKITRRLVEKKWTGAFAVGPDSLVDLLGVPRHRGPETPSITDTGTAVALAWTPAGGEILMPETSVVPGRGTLDVTGQIGEVMQESAKAALTYVRSRAAELGIDPRFHQLSDIHIHVPGGAIPKDGPSAGVALAVGLVSALAGTPARADLAMTGEITLRGRVLPVGGIKEKLLAAHRSRIKTVILPRENEKDLAELPADVAGELEIILVEHLDEVLPRALDRAFPGVSFVGAAEQHDSARPQ